MLKAFLDDVTGELVVAEFNNSALDTFDYPIFILKILAML
jgi:hypothetical protein